MRPSPISIYINTFGLPMLATLLILYALIVDYIETDSMTSVSDIKYSFDVYLYFLFILENIIPLR